MNPFPSAHKSLGPEFLQQTSNTSRLIIRSVQSKDLLPLAEVLADSFHSRTGLACWFYPLLRMGIYEDLRSRFRSAAPDYVCLVAVEPAHPTVLADSRSASEYVAGTVEMALRTSAPWQNRQSQYLYLSNLAVRKECRRQGIAQQLLQSCERIARSWGFPDLYLHVMENNDQARGLYSKLEYRLQQVEPDWGALMLRQPRRCLLHKHLS
ncbi:MAG: GNAT family N-acetyltransferase [Leptolyngbyaceae bacterium]|nr:GNAT family N-acetyltransferase [Leptolyngbyaceae bacterium]